MRNRNRFRTIFPALGTNIFGRVRRSYDQDIHTLELKRIAEIMGVKYSATKLRKTRKLRRVRGRKMTRSDNHVIKNLFIHTVVY